jgi:DNA uptake protein ComE-like DNA-binding protein
MQKSEWKEYFTFSKKERIAVFILLAIMAIFIFFSFWYQPVFTKPAIDAKVQQQLAVISAHHNNTYVDTIGEEVKDSTGETHTVKVTENAHGLFYFDPNILDSAGWRRLGFGEKTVEQILDYRKTKGRFNKAADLFNVYRIRKKSVEAIIPYVRIGPGLNQSSAQNKNAIPVETKTATAPAATNWNYKPINVNTATAQDFKMFPGVSDAVANRIVKFRTSINGFTSVDDVAKTYGLPDSSFRIMRPYLKL